MNLKTILSCCFFLSLGVTVKSQTHVDTLEGKFKIIKLDSVKKIYIVYAKMDDKLYKIFSDDTPYFGRKLIVGRTYSMVLISTLPQGTSPRHYGGQKVSGELIKFEKGFEGGLYVSPNLKGLYYVKKRRIFNSRS